VLDTHEFSFKMRLPVFKKHFNYFPEVAMKLIQRLALGMCSGETGNISDKKAGIGATFNDCRKSSHNRLFRGAEPDRKTAPMNVGCGFPNACDTQFIVSILAQPKKFGSSFTY
jgi:hypothetical protein